jgi:hypothetical protein
MSLEELASKKWKRWKTEKNITSYFKKFGGMFSKTIKFDDWTQTFIDDSEEKLKLEVGYQSIQMVVSRLEGIMIQAPGR